MMFKDEVENRETPGPGGIKRCYGSWERNEGSDRRVQTCPRCVGGDVVILDPFPLRLYPCPDLERPLAAGEGWGVRGVGVSPAK